MGLGRAGGLGCAVCMLARALGPQLGDALAPEEDSPARELAAHGSLHDRRAALPRGRRRLGCRRQPLSLLLDLAPLLIALLPLAQREQPRLMPLERRRRRRLPASEARVSGRGLSQRWLVTAVGVGAGEGSIH